MLPVLLFIFVCLRVNVTCFIDYSCLCSGEWLPVLLIIRFCSGECWFTDYLCVCSG